MVKITNGINTFEVTNGAFEGIYKHQGFSLVNAKTKKTAKPENVEKTIEQQIEEILETPLSNWGKNQLKLFTEHYKIDTSDCEKASDVRAKIKAFLDEQEKDNDESINKDDENAED